MDVNHPDPTDPTGLTPLAPDDADAEPDGGEADARFTVRSEWSMVRVSRKRWFR